MEPLLSCLAITNVRLGKRKRQTKFGFFMEQFFASAMARKHIRRIRQSAKRSPNGNAITVNEKLTVKPHPAPLASTQDFEDCAICEIDGKIEVQQAELLPVASGAGMT